MGAQSFGDLWFLDHVDIVVKRKKFIVLIMMDAASNLIWVGPQKNKEMETTQEAMDRCMRELNCKPTVVCADSYFMSRHWKKTLRIHRSELD